MNGDYVWTLIARKLTREASPRELRELNELLEYDSVLEEKLKIITEFWKSNNRNPAMKNNEAFEQYYKIKFRRLRRMDRE